MSALKTIQAFVMIETAHAHAHGDSRDVIKAEIDALKELIRKAEIELELSKETAIDLGFAFMREQHTPEHVVRAHTKHYFTWHKA